jgi:hypothetical protein
VRLTRGFCFALLAVGLAAGGPARAQERWNYEISYQASFPSSRMKEFADRASWRGGGVDLRRETGRHSSIGLSLGWHVFDRRSDQPVSIGGVDLSGDHIRYVNSFPMLINAELCAGGRQHARFLLGAGAGGYLMEHRVEIGSDAIGETRFHFGFAPEAGVRIPLGELSGVVLRGRYNYALSSKDIPRQSYWTVGIGYAWSDW